MDGWRNDDRRVALTQVKDMTVSTVRLPIDHGFGTTPIWYETMVFKHDNDIYCERYSTELEASIGHLHAVRWAKKQGGVWSWLTKRLFKN